MKVEPCDDGLLQTLHRTVASRLGSHGRPRHFDTGEVLFRQGEPNQYLHAIVRGRVKVERVYPNLLSTMVLAEVGPGEVAGEEGLLYGSLRRTTATAVEETDTLEVPSEALADVLAEQLHETAELLQLLRRQAGGPDIPASAVGDQEADGRLPPATTGGD